MKVSSTSATSLKETNILKSERTASIELDAMYNKEFEGFLTQWDEVNHCIMLDFESTEILTQLLAGAISPDHPTNEKAIKEVIEKLKSHTTAFLDAKYGRSPYDDDVLYDEYGNVIVTSNECEEPPDPEIDMGDHVGSPYGDNYDQPAPSSLDLELGAEPSHPHKSICPNCNEMEMREYGRGKFECKNCDYYQEV